MKCTNLLHFQIKSCTIENVFIYPNHSEKLFVKSFSIRTRIIPYRLRDDFSCTWHTQIIHIDSHNSLHAKCWPILSVNMCIIGPRAITPCNRVDRSIEWGLWPATLYINDDNDFVLFPQCIEMCGRTKPHFVINPKSNKYQIVSAFYLYCIKSTPGSWTLQKRLVPLV